MCVLFGKLLGNSCSVVHRLHPAFPRVWYCTNIYWGVTNSKVIDCKHPNQNTLGASHLPALLETTSFPKKGNKVKLSGKTQVVTRMIGEFSSNFPGAGSTPLDRGWKSRVTHQETLYIAESVYIRIVSYIKQIVLQYGWSLLVLALSWLMIYPFYGCCSSNPYFSPLLWSFMNSSIVIRPRWLTHHFTMVNSRV